MAPIRILNPPSLQDPTPSHYSHIAITAPDTRFIHLAGQIGADKSGNTPSDLTSQARQALSNVKTCLAEAGATVRNIVNITIYIVDYDAATCPIWDTYKVFLTDEQGTYCPPGTLVPVPALASPEFKIEVQCVAAVQESAPLISRPTHAALTDVDVVVVGAGLSGLRAATNVQSAGLSCVVLEAKDRVGGKTQSVKMNTGNGMVDVGAAWINDKTQTRMYALYKKFGCEPLVQRMKGAELFRDGKIEATRIPYPGFPPVRSSLLCSWRLNVC